MSDSNRPPGTFQSLAALVLCALAATGCGQDPGDDDPAASRAEVAAAPSAPRPGPMNEGPDDAVPADGAPVGPSAQGPATAEPPGGEAPTAQGPPPPDAQDISPTIPGPAPTGTLAPRPDDIRPVASVYRSDGYGTVDVVRLDVRTRTAPGRCVKGDYDGCTFADILADVDRRDEIKPRIDVHLTAPDYPDDGLFVNAEMRQRGGTTRKAPQKSFRLRLDDKDALWRRERSIYLNKHPYESDRIRNKLAFDLMSEIPNLMSSRTQFANLWLDDGAGPTDLGLFTHVEAPGANWLRKRGLNKDDRLYKVDYFRFGLNDLQDLQVDAEGAPIDEDRFERALEIEAGDDHRPLVKMLTDFHDPARSFDSILDQYFNRNNVLTWMATNFLLHQTDAVTHNFILYNPLGTERFYFLPWDYDGGFVAEAEPPVDGWSNTDLQRRLYYGYARGVNSRFHDRYYRLPGIHDRIVEAAEHLRANYLTDANIAERANRMAEVVRPYVSRSPDIDFNPTWNEYSVAAFPRHVADNMEALRSRYGLPMPPEMDEKPARADGATLLGWSRAHDPTGHEITYDLQVGVSPVFTPAEAVLEIAGIPDAPERIEWRLEDERLGSGTYYARAIARTSADPARWWQVPSNRLRQDGTEYHGVVRFVVP